jgi:hypothetical protein
MRWVIIILLLPSLVYSQNEVNGNAFLKRGLDVFTIQSSVQNYRSVKVPLVNEMDFRTESRDFDVERQEYTFRLKPSSPKKIKAQKDLSEHILNAEDFDEAGWKCDMTKRIHDAWLNLYIKNEEILFHKQLMTILQDKLIVMERKKAALQFDVADWLNLKEQISETSFFIEKTASDIQAISKSFDYAPGEKYDFSEVTNIIEIESIILNDEIQFSESAEDSYEKNLIQKEIQLEEAEKKQVVDFAQIRYRGPHDNLIRERLSIGLAFTLNTSGDNNRKISELGLELEQLENRSKRENKEKAIEMNALKNTILGDISSYRSFVEIHRKERQELETLASQLQAKTDFDPLDILKIKERLLLIGIDELEMKEDLYSNFIEFNQDSGRMCSSDQNVLVSRFSSN